MVVNFYKEHRHMQHIWFNFLDNITKDPKPRGTMAIELAKFNARYLKPGEIHFKKKTDFAMFLLRWA